jgi:uncharacterized protein involved in outer membrane biogenesis
VAEALGRALGRPVRLGGLGLAPALPPRLAVRRLVLESPEGFAEPLARVQRGELRIDLGALVGGRVRIAGLRAQGVRLVLATRDDGATSWEAEGAPGGRPSIGIEDLALRDVSVAVVGPDGRDALRLELDEVEGALPAAGASRLRATGSLRGQDGRLELEGGGLDAMLARGETWPVEGSVAWAEARAEGSGAIEDLLGFDGVDLRLVVAGASLPALGEGLGIALPDLGPIELRGRLELREGTLHLGELELRAAGSRLEGQLAIATRGRVRLDGLVRAGRLDLDALRARLVRDAPDAGAPGAFEALRGFDARLRVAALDVLAGELETTGVAGELRLEGGTLEGELSGDTVAGHVAAQGRLETGGASPGPAFRLEGRAAALDVEALARALDAPGSVRGRLSDVRLEGRGAGEDLLAGLGGRLEVGTASLGRAAPDAEPIGLERFEATLAPGGALVARGAVVLAGGRVAARGRVAQPRALLRGAASAVEVTLAGAGLEASLEGRVQRDPPGARLALRAAGERIGALPRALGIAPDAALPFALRGDGQLDAGRLRVELAEVRVGGSALAGELQVVRRGEQLEVSGALRAARLDPAELAGVFRTPAPSATQAPARGMGGVARLLDRVRPGAAGLEIRVAELAGTPLESLSARARLRAGRVVEAPFEVRIASVPFRGTALADVGGDEPLLSLELAARDVDLGALLTGLGLVQQLDARAHAFSAQFRGAGTTRAALLADGELRVELSDGIWRLRDPNTGGVLEIPIAQGRASAEPGGRLRMMLEGRSDSHPLRIRFRGPALAALAQPEPEVPLLWVARFGETRLRLEGEAQLPLTHRRLGLVASLDGERLDELGTLLGVALPPIGPYAARGRLRVRKGGYELTGAQISLGSSELHGGGRLDTTASPPRLSGFVYGGVLQLDDVRPEIWDVLPVDGSAGRGAADAPDAPPKRLLTAGRLHEIDGIVTLEIEEVRSGETRLGAATARLQVGAGRLAVAPLELELPGGDGLFLAWYYAPGEDARRAELVARAPAFDYGFVARRLAPASPMEGRASLDVELVAEAPPGERLLGHARGRLDVAAWPRHLGAGLVDSWSLNLIQALLPVFKISHSTVNCIVARLDVENGVARPDALLLDTTTVRVEGGGRIDFGAGRIDLTLRPRPKLSQVASLQTPLVIRGKLDDFRPGVRVDHLLGTVFRFAASPVTGPLGWLFRPRPPRDGSDVCTDPMRWDEHAG